MYKNDNVVFDYTTIQNYKIFLNGFEKGLQQEDIDSLLSKKNYDKLKSIESASLIIDYLIYNLNKLSTNRFIISIKDFSIALNRDKNFISGGLFLLKKCKAVSISRKGMINGNTSIILNLERVIEIENKGIEIIDKEIEEREIRTLKTFKEVEQRVKENKRIIEEGKKKVWSEEKSLAISKMAYSDLESIYEDSFNTGLDIVEKLMISFISKAWYRYTGFIIRWDYRIFLTVRKALIRASTKNMPQDLYINLLRTNCCPQKIIDIIKFTSSIWYTPITESTSKIFAAKFSIACNNGFKKMNDLLYSLEGKKDPSFLYNEYYRYDTFEDETYYKNSVDSALKLLEGEQLKVKPRLKKNPFNDIDPDSIDYRVADVRIHIKPDLLKVLKDNYEKLHPNKNQGISNSKEDPLAIFR